MQVFVVTDRVAPASPRASNYSFKFRAIEVITPADDRGALVFTVVVFAVLGPLIGAGLVLGKSLADVAGRL